MPTSSFAPNPSEAFPYRVDGEAGAGAMGVVYRAIDVNLERKVAIKVLKPDAQTGPSEERSKRFLQEARAAAALSHPGVATVYQIGKVSGLPYIAMEWLEGETLEQVLARGTAPIEQASKYLFELLDVLDVAHRAGIVHRDIKPSNLMVLEGGRLKVTDFGIARLMEGQNLVETVAGAVMATPRYASPEQLQGSEVDGRTDLFSAAVIFYQLLTGAWPWDGRNLGELITSILSDDPVPLRKRHPGFSANLESWFLQALAKTQEDRFPTASDMAQALRDTLDPPAESSQRVELTRTTKVTAPPVYTFVAQSATTAWETLFELIRSWESRDIGTMGCHDLLDKILEEPLHTEAFAGAAVFGEWCLLIEKGMVLAAVPLQSGRPDPEADLPAKALATLYTLPPRFDAGTVTLLASALQEAPARHAGLDSLTVNLMAMASKLLDQDFEGLLRLEQDGNVALVPLLQRKAGLALVSAGWPNDPCKIGWQPWIESLSASASFLEKVTIPPALWYRRGFRDLEILAKPRGDSDWREGTALSDVVEADSSSAPELFETHYVDGRNAGDSSSLSTPPMGEFFEWMLGDLPHFLVDRQRSAGWKYLSDWLLLIRKARFYTKVTRPGTSETDAFDLVTEDRNGKILHLGQRLGFVDTARFQQFVDRAIAAKEARTKQGDIGGAFLISPSFSAPVMDAYKTLLHQGLSNRWLGIDRSKGYEGFVRLSARRGFHLLLVEERDGAFHPKFVT